MHVILTNTGGPAAPREMVLQPQSVVQIGRGQAVDFSAPEDAMMSSVHCRIERGTTLVQLRDLASTNGTFLNGNRIEKSKLADGDQIMAGQTTFVVRITDAARGAETVSGPEESDYRAAFQDEDPLVRREALHAAVWTRQPWLLDYCRKAAAKPSLDGFDAIYLLAVLGGSDELPLLLSPELQNGLGAKRFDILGAYGHPQVMDQLLAGIASDDPKTAVAAGIAFTRVTGHDIESDERVELPPEDGSEPDEFEKEFLDDAFLPLQQKAEDHWHQVQEHYGQGSRWCRGYNLSHGISDEVFEQLDMQSRYEVRLREKYNGSWSGSLADLERFPLCQRQTIRTIGTVHTTA